MKTLLRIIAGDPARSNDFFGVIGIESDIKNDIVKIQLVKQFKRQRYSTVAAYFQMIKSQINPDFMILEKNFEYEDVSKAFSHLPIQYMTTSANLKEQTIYKGNSMDKTYMIKWFNEHKKNHKIIFPPRDKSSPDAEELINQIQNIGSFPTLTGGTTYKAMRSRHDDIFMALLLCCCIHMILRKQYLDNV